MQIIHGHRGDFSNPLIFAGTSIFEDTFSFDHPVDNVYGLLEGFYFSWFESDKTIHFVRCEIKIIFRPAISRVNGKFQLICTFNGGDGLIIHGAEYLAAFSYILIGV